MEWERFVTIKELMHCYFAPIESNVKYLTGNELALERHINVFFGGATTKSAPSAAEKMALWMAVGVLSTERDRQDMLVKLGDKSLVPQQIADEMRIPLKQAKNLVSSVYSSEIASLTLA